MKDNITNKEEKIEIIQKPKKSKKNVILFFLFFVVTFLLIGSYFLYQKLSFSEKDARENANRLFSMLSMSNLESKLVSEVYPDFSKIDNYILLKRKCIITNISENSDGDFEVYANYKLSANSIYPIFLIIGKVDNKIIVKSSKGLCYAYYNNLLEYGKKKGCLIGSENDVEMATIIKNKNLQVLYNIDISSKYSEIKKNIEINDNINSSGYGFINGNITLYNNNNFNLSSLDFDCELILYNYNDEIVHSDKIYFFQGINSHSSASSNVMTSSHNSVKYKVNIKLRQGYSLKNKIETLVIQEAYNDCK
jgi:hypothetical protein